MNILSAAKHYDMFSPGDKVLVAVSGGPDSVAMLHALHTHSQELGISLHVAHLNHGIRGEQSNLDEVFVRDLAHSLGLPITVGNVDVPSLRVKMHIGEEEAGRIERYKFLQYTSTEIDADKIAIGHTADDRAESVLLNIIRGCGVDGLGSIRPVSGNIVRPLIEATRADVERYIAEHALPYRIDESNADTTYTRNRVRHKLIPMLEREFNPEIRTALTRLANIASAQSDFMSSLVDSTRHKIAYRDGLDATLLAQLPQALRYQVIRSEIERIRGDLNDITYEQVEGVAQALLDCDDFTITLPPGDIYASCKGNSFRIWEQSESPTLEPFDYIVNVHGNTSIPAFTLTCEIDTKPIPSKLPLEEAMIDVDSIIGKMRVRNIMPGDRVVPMGMTGSKKLQDVFVDKKVRKHERARAAVVVDDEKVLWVIGIVASELGKITKTTMRAFHLISERR